MSTVRQQIQRSPFKSRARFELERADVTGETVGMALRLVDVKSRRLAEACGVDDSRVRHWWSGSASPFLTVAVFCSEVGMRAMSVLAAMEAIAFQATLRDMPTEDLVEMFWQHKRREVAEEAAENTVAEELAAPDGDVWERLKELRNTTMREAATGKELCGIINELIARNVDPRLA